MKKHKTYKFKHPIYLEAVCDYFFLKHFEYVVAYKPLDVLRICDLYDVSRGNLKILSERLQKNLLECAFFKVLEYDMFKDFYFEESFCRDLRKKCVLESKMHYPDATSVFKFP